MANTKSRERILHRHEITEIPYAVEKHLNAYNQAERIALVWLIFHKHYTLFESMGFVDNGFCDNPKVKWHSLDNFVLDNSKTFVNGKVYI